MSYRCEICGVKFDEPRLSEKRVNLDGENGWWTDVQAYCPVCGYQEFEEIVEEDD